MSESKIFFIRAQTLQFLVYITFLLRNHHACKSWEVFPIFEDHFKWFLMLSEYCFTLPWLPTWIRILWVIHWSILLVFGSVGSLLTLVITIWDKPYRNITERYDNHEYDIWHVVGYAFCELQLTHALVKHDFKKRYLPTFYLPTFFQKFSATMMHVM